MNARRFLEPHLNVWWLRPEQALWDAISSEIVARAPLRSPSLDMGCGNGMYSFITQGGRFSADYDWFSNSDVRGFHKNRDVFDAALASDPSRHVTARARRSFDWGIDLKPTLLAQAARLPSFYGKTAQADAEKRLPFEDETFKTVFSNILYWLNDPRHGFKELARVLMKGGQAQVCLQHPRFKTLCESYQWQKKRSKLLKLLNRGRSACHYWTATLDDVNALAKASGLKVVHHAPYLGPSTLRFWDVGLRPLSPPLIQMAQRLAPKDRREVKALWLESTMPLLEEMLAQDLKDKSPKGFHFTVLEKI